MNIKEKIMAFTVFFFLVWVFANLIFDTYLKITGKDCEAYAKKASRQYSYSITQGCMIEHNGRWYSKDELKFVLGVGNE